MGSYVKGTHAVAAFDCVKHDDGSRKILAVNSWGASDPYVHISEKDLCEAWIITVNNITEKKGKVKRVPKQTPYFTSLLKENENLTKKEHCLREVGARLPKIDEGFQEMKNEIRKLRKALNKKEKELEAKRKELSALKAKAKPADSDGDSSSS